MGIFYEDTPNNVKTKDSITLAEMRELIKEKDELLSELLDLTLENINESMMFTESVWSDFKVKKEDLADPNKIKALITKIENERIGMDSKAQLLNTLYVFLLPFAGMVPGMVLAGIGSAMDFTLFAGLGLLFIYIGPIIALYVGSDRHEMLISKIKKAIKKVDKQIKKESNPEYKKILQDQKHALEMHLDTLQKENIESRTTYGYNVNYNYNIN